MSEISTRLKQTLEKKGVSYGELSKRTGYPKSALQRYATGQTGKVPIDRLEKIAESLQVSTAFLMGWDDNPVPYRSSDSDLLPAQQARIVSENIQYLMNRRQRNYDWLARAVGNQSSDTLRRYALGDQVPSYMAAKSIARALDVDFDTFSTTNIEIKQKRERDEGKYKHLLQSMGIQPADDYLCDNVFCKARRYRFVEQMLASGVLPDEIIEKTGVSSTDIRLCLQGCIHKLSGKKAFDIAACIKTTTGYLFLKTNDPYCYYDDDEERLKRIPEDECKEIADGVEDNHELVWRIWADSKKEVYDDPKALRSLLAYERLRDSYDYDLEALEPIIKKLLKIDIIFRESVISMIERFIDWYLQDPVDEYFRNDENGQN